MKTSILGILFLSILTQQVAGQALVLHGVDTLKTSTDVFTIQEASVQVKNLTNRNIHVFVSREILTLAADHINYFCWGANCYGPATNFSIDTLTIAPQEEELSFKGYLDPGGVSGISKIRYCFYNTGNQPDRKCFDVKYIFGTTAIEPTSNNNGIAIPSVPASYDSYSQTIKVKVSSGKIDVMNMLGQSVDLKFQYDGTGMVADASSLKTGYYFLFGTNEKGPWSARVIVTK